MTVLDFFCSAKFNSSVAALDSLAQSGSAPMHLLSCGLHHQEIDRVGKCDSQLFLHFTAECVQKLMAKLQGDGMASAADLGLKPGVTQATYQDVLQGHPPASSVSGKASKKGFEISWQYDPAAQSLTVQCTNSPFYAPCSTINAQIRNLVESCYAAPPQNTA